MNFQYEARVRVRFHSFLEPCVYDAIIISKNGDSFSGSSRHLKSEMGAIEYAFHEFKNKVLMNTNERAFDFVLFSQKFEI